MTADVWAFRDFRPISAGDVDLPGFEVMGRDGSIGYHHGLYDTGL